jgi:plastocyanin
MNVSFRTRLFSAWPAALALAFCGGCATQNTPNQPNSTAIVEMHFHSFEPKSVTIHVGDAVEWRNTTPFIYHTVTADPAKAEKPADVALPPGAEPFDSGHVASGSSYQRVFILPGTYRYFCEPHESKGMVGEVIVLSGNQAPPQAVEPAPAPATAPATPPTTQTSAEPVTHPLATQPATP